MFLQTITLFNYIYSTDEYSSTLLSNVEFQPFYKTYPNIYETELNTSALIIVPLIVDSSGIYALSNVSKKYYLPFKQWKENKDYFTIQNNFDFVILGDYTHLENINLNELKNSLDDVFIINGFKYFMDDLKHFEIYLN